MANLNGWTERYNSIISDTPGTINIAPWSGKDPSTPYYAISSIGTKAVLDNKAYIDKYSNKFGIDEKLLESIVYLENSHGWYDFGMGSSVRPANIIPELWGSITGWIEPSEIITHPSANIATAAKLLAEIKERLPNATLAEIATLYNKLSAKQVTKYGKLVEKYAQEKPWENSPPECFLAGTSIAMADGTEKPIEEVKPEDWVLSYDKDGKLQSGRVTRTFINTAKQILDVHGLMVTPGHVTLCGDGKFDGEHVPIMDILRSDGALVMKDGTKVRAATGCPLGSLGDRFIHAIIGEKQSDGRVKVKEVGQLRLGTRFILENDEDLSILDIIQERGGMISEDGYIQTDLGSAKMPFRWIYSSNLPKPEDYVLQRSATTLGDIYQANEWEAVQPQMPMPAFAAMPSASISEQPAVIQAAPSNVPLSMRGHPQAQNQGMSRKQRRAADARARKASKSKSTTLH
ncbi:Hint domain-containing protein [Cohaesibacter celericrescens]|uniref:Hint domain-containing protein n=1 Tax=Cohaesibacter celericrescens TaxID=2067669 RepID=A0A2N5XXG2_9HYPH|nr:Hint domain-containing protein [Cohaesibacter celericrescens]PLW79179.1 hypothetical protein C0081_02850 [Cohaesibacter celericrescens]